MNLEKFDEKHYQSLVEWWKEHNHPIISYESLSPLGVVCTIDNVPSCMSFLYVMHGCDLAQIAWTTTNPKALLRNKYKAVNACIESLYDIAAVNNRKNIICFSSSSGLNKILNKHGLNTGVKHDLLAGYFGDK